MTYVRGSSNIHRYSRRRRAQALNFKDRERFPIW
jgi:hypothetical protein